MEDKTNQPEKIPAPKVRKITPLDLLKRDVKLYRADCMMSVGNDKKCRPCTAAFFESILGMIDRIALQESIARQEREKQKTEKWIDFQVVNSGFSKCPTCGSEWDWVDNEVNRFKYCPHCGTKKKVEK